MLSFKFHAHRLFTPTPPPHYTPARGETKLLMTIVLYGLQAKDGGYMHVAVNGGFLTAKLCLFSVSRECAYFCELVRSCIPRRFVRLSD